MREPNEFSRESYQVARAYFIRRMELGTRPQIYCMIRLAGGEYLSRFTEDAWQHFVAGWLTAGGTSK